jgi:hypothetical protein
VAVLWVKGSGGDLGKSTGNILNLDAGNVASFTR